MLKAAITALLQDFSIEQTPSEAMLLHARPTGLRAGSRVYIPWIGGNAFERTLRAAVRLRELGLEPVPHLAARAIHSTAALDGMLGALRREAAVIDALLVAGSIQAPLGPFEGVAPALATGLFEHHRWRALGVAGHPEGSPDIGAATLAAALDAKNAYAQTSPLRMRLVTQFCFEGAPLLDWERRVRASGNRLAIHVGLAGLASLPTLIRYARSCGVGASLGVLTRRHRSVLRLMSAVAPDEIVTTLAAGRLADPDCLIDRLHFFPFGSFEATVAWAGALAAGAFSVDPEERSIRV